MLNDNDYNLLLHSVRVAELTLGDAIEKIAKEEKISKENLDYLIEYLNVQMQSIKNDLEFCKTS